MLREKANAEDRDEAIGNLLCTMLFPAAHKVQEAVDRARQTKANLHLAFALACYQHEHGDYPRKLETLAPKYLAKIPGDLFSGKVLIYCPAAGGYLLYSIGVNGKDEQGRTSEDDPPGDDLVVRMPLPRLLRK